MPTIRRGVKVRARPQAKPPGTRCYVPGYVDDATQFAIDQSQLGVAPAVVGVASGAVKLATGGRVLGVSFKTPAHKRAAKEAPALYQRAIAGDNAALVELERLSRQAATSKAKAIFRQWYDKAIAAGAGKVQATAPAPAPGQPAIAPPAAPAPPPPSGVTPPSVPTIGPITVTLPQAPSPGYIPAPPSTLPGGEPQVPPETGATTQQAGMFGAEGLKGALPLLALGLALMFGRK